MERTRILVIDDEPDMRGFLKDALEHQGYEVETSGALPGAVASLVAGRYDLLTLDLNMPDMNGVDVARLAQAVDTDLPVVVISGYLNARLESDLREHGVRYFLKKPVRIAQLMETVERALGESHQPNP